MGRYCVVQVVISASSCRVLASGNENVYNGETLQLLASRPLRLALDSSVILRVVTFDQQLTQLQAEPQSA